MKKRSLLMLLLALLVVGVAFGFSANWLIRETSKPTLAQKAASHKLTANEVVERFRNGDVYTRLLLTGTANAYNWANASLQAEGKTALFCGPDVVLTVDQEVVLMARHIERYPQSGENPAGATMLQALKEAFPCKQAKLLP
jgi:hypothetical protein